MSIAAHVVSLQEKHAKYKEAIAAEMARPSPDFAVLASLKKHKLHVKEELLRYSAVLPEARLTAS